MPLADRRAAARGETVAKRKPAVVARPRGRKPQSLGVAEYYGVLCREAAALKEMHGGRDQWWLEPINARVL